MTAFSSTVTLFGLSTKSQDKLFPLVGLRPRRYVTNVISYCSVRKLNSQIVLCRRAPYPSVHASRRKATNVRRGLFGWQASRLNDALCDHPRSAEGNPGKCLFGANPRGCIYLVAEKREREECGLGIGGSTTKVPSSSPPIGFSRQGLLLNVLSHTDGRNFSPLKEKRPFFFLAPPRLGRSHRDRRLFSGLFTKVGRLVGLLLLRKRSASE